MQIVEQAKYRNKVKRQYDAYHGRITAKKEWPRHEHVENRINKRKTKKAGLWSQRCLYECVRKCPNRRKPTDGRGRTYSHHGAESKTQCRAVCFIRRARKRLTVK